MHYRNGREAKNGDKVVLVSGYGAPMVGVPPAEQSVEQLPCLVMRATPDGYVVGRALVDASEVEWLSPTHVRPYTESRPKDVHIPAVVQASFTGGNVELKKARLAKGVPVQTQVGVEVIFGEALDAAALRAKRELKAQVDALVRERVTYWRHLCAAAPISAVATPGVVIVRNGDWPTLRSLPHGEVCECGAVESKASAA